MGRQPIPPTASPRGLNGEGKRGEHFEPWPWLQGPAADFYRSKPKPQLTRRPVLREPPNTTPSVSSSYTKQKRIDGPGRYEPLVAPRPVTGDYFPKLKRIDGAARFESGGWGTTYSPRFQTREQWQDFRLGSSVRPPTARAGVCAPPVAQSWLLLNDRRCALTLTRMVTRRRNHPGAIAANNAPAASDGPRFAQVRPAVMST